MIEEAEYTVCIFLTTTMTFSPMERNTALTGDDAMQNAFGLVPDELWEFLRSEGFMIGATAVKND